MKLSLSEARKIVLSAQLLDGRSNIAPGKEGTFQIIDHLGYVQIDTISVIQRAHHHVLWTRQPDYQPDFLHQLQQNDRRIFEFWGHAMSYMPMTDFRFALPRMKNLEVPKTPWAKKQYDVSGHLLEPVLERIRKEGPLTAKDFEHEKKKNSGWWDWKPAKVALELLFWRGELMITERHKFQKKYDLTEKVLPQGIDRRFPNRDEIGYFLVKRAVKSLGLATEKEILRFMQPGSARDSDLQLAGKEIIKSTLQSMVEAKEIIPVLIEGLDGDIFYMAPNGEKKTVRRTVPPVHILSPFDNLVIQRERTKRLFNFDYTIECYVPEKKRKFGYFVLPILWGDRFVGRMDSKTDRKEKTLRILKLYFEEGFDDFEKFLPVFAQKLGKFKVFNNCTEIQIPENLNSKFGPEVRKIIS